MIKKLIFALTILVFDQCYSQNAKVASNLDSLLSLKNFLYSIFFPPPNYYRSSFYVDNNPQERNIGINHINLPDKLIQQYEKTIQLLEDQVDFLKKLVK